MQREVKTLFFDMNSYFASVCQAEEPELRGRPVAVVTTVAPGAACIAASIEAKRKGVGMGVRIKEARQLCPGIVFRPAKHDVFVAYHHRIKAAVDTVIPIAQAHSVDEFSCHLMGRQRKLETALSLGRDLQAAITDQVSPALLCSVGVAPNKLLAKVAAELQKPAGLNWLTPDVLPDKIAHLALDDIGGISRGILARLTRAEVQDVRSLYAMTPKQARHVWGNVTGEYFLRQLHGESVVHPEQRHRSLGHGQQLTSGNRTPRAALLVTRRLLIKAAARLRREDNLAGVLQISVKCTRHGRGTRALTFPPTQDSFILLQHLAQLWQDIAVATPVSVGVMLGRLQPVSEVMGDLLLDRPAGAVTPREHLCGAIDKLNQRFGQDTIRFGELPPHKVPYTGAKIAFGRIPDAEDFYE
jgi:DNA polymerase-4